MSNIDVTKLVTVDDKFQALKDTQVAAISAGCAAAIFAGFTSSALGAAYTYPFKTTDQQNLSDSVLASTLPGVTDTWTTPFWCADSTGAWAMRGHTAAQIQQVGTDAMTRKLACMAQNDTLAAQVNAITDPTKTTDVQAIVWVDPAGGSS
jgi:hypothetical protein